MGESLYKPNIICDFSSTLPRKILLSLPLHVTCPSVLPLPAFLHLVHMDHKPRKVHAVMQHNFPTLLLEMLSYLTSSVNVRIHPREVP